MSKPKISIVVLAYSLDSAIDEMTQECVNSLEGQGDELIIVDNGSPVFYPWMMKKADKYIRLKKNVGYVKGMNVGALLATGTHIVFVTSDTKLIKGNLVDLCQGEEICFPEVETENSQYDIQHDGSFYAAVNIPYLLHDERYEFYFSDKDIFEKAKKIGVDMRVVESVVISHHGWKTTTIEGLKEERYERDKKAFKKKWGYLPEGEND